jgi:hypothetical protein
LTNPPHIRNTQINPAREAGERKEMKAADIHKGQKLAWIKVPDKMLGTLTEVTVLGVWSDGRVRVQFESRSWNGEPCTRSETVLSRYLYPNPEALKAERAEYREAERRILEEEGIRRQEARNKANEIAEGLGISSYRVHPQYGDFRITLEIEQIAEIVEALKAFRAS